MKKMRKLLAMLLALCMVWSSTAAVSATDTSEPTPAVEVTATPEVTAEPTAEPTVVSSIEPGGESDAEPAEESTPETVAEPTEEPTPETDAETTEESTPEMDMETTEEPSEEPTEEPIYADAYDAVTGEEIAWFELTYVDEGGEPTETYTITIEPSEHGAVTADRTTGLKQGDSVALTVKLDAGYVLDAITVMPTVSLTGNSDGTWSFQMPASSVSVNAAFKLAEPSYIITIPAGLNLNETQTLTISVDEVENLNGKEIVVNVDSDGTLEYSGNEIKYSLNTSSFSFTQDGSFDLKLTVGDTTGKPAGEYEDTLTFTSTVQERTGEE